jgi:ABC-type sugar transport system substrate-binding protein
MNRRVGPAAVATIAAALTLAACGSSSDSDSGGSNSSTASGASATKGLVIGDILFDADAYQIAQQKQMQKYADSLGIKMVFENQKGQGTAAPNLMEDLMAKNVDGIIFQPADANVATPLVRQAQAKKTPVLGWAIPFNPEITAPYVGLDEQKQAFAAGKRAAEYVQKNFPGKPVKALIVTITGVSICKDVRMGPFEQGVKSVAPSASFITINGAGDRNKAVTVTEDALQRDKDFNIATGCNSDMSMGALQAFKSAGLGGASGKKPQHTYFYSINGTDEELRALTDPSSPVMEVLGLTPKEVAKTLIDTTVKMIKGQTNPNSNYRANVPDKPLSTDCATVNAFNKEEYFASQDLPCVGS